MIKYKHEIINKEVDIRDSIECDICHASYSYNNDICDSKDVMERQEFIHIHFIGGYGSVFGDGDKIDYNICQHCFHDWLKSKNALKENNDSN